LGGRRRSCIDVRLQAVLTAWDKTNKAKLGGIKSSFDDKSVGNRGDRRRAGGCRS
jgi:hypothetical protein